MIFIPTRGRPIHMKRFIFHYDMLVSEEPVAVFLDEDDAKNYDQVAFPSHWKIHIHGARCGITEIMNKGFALYPDEQAYGVLADDVVPATPKWDATMKAVAIPHGIVWADDGLQGEKLPTHPFIGGDLVRALGWVSYPGVKHWFADNIWLDIGRALGTSRYMQDVKLEHMHPASGKAPMDRTYMEQPAHAVDQEAYKKFHESGEFIRLIERVRATLTKQAA